MGKGGFAVRKTTAALALAGAMILLLAGCGGTASEGTDLTADVSGSGGEAVYASAAEVPAADTAALTDFGLDLLRQCAGEGNVLLSPASVLSALGMTANGAGGQTLAQFEEAFGLPLEELNAALSAALPEDDGILACANAIWFNSRNGLEVDRSFLQTNADWYGAGLFSVPFGSDTPKEINQWVSEHTRGMIPSILDQVQENAVMYLVNALAFDGEWVKPFDSCATMQGTFTREDGTEETADFMHGEEYAYLEGEKVTGFLKSYRDGSYAFAALLPGEGVTVAEALDSLSGGAVGTMLDSVSSQEVIIALPKFTVDYDAGLEDVLPALGIVDAFDPSSADFSGIGTAADGGPSLFISRVLHKTHLSVDELGTEAAAATVVEMTEGAMELEEPPKQVILDRPFLYMLVDLDSGLPLFLGTVMTVED